MVVGLASYTYVTVVREDVPTLATCVAHFMAFYGLRESLQRMAPYRSMKTAFFVNVFERRELKRDLEYAEYRRQRAHLELRYGELRVDRALERLIKKSVALHRIEKWHEARQDGQRHFHGCFSCAHVCTEADNLDDWCKKLKEEPNLFRRCSLFEQREDDRVLFA